VRAAQSEARARRVLRGTGAELAWGTAKGGTFTMPPCVSSASLHTRRGQTSPHTLAALAEETLRTLNQSICAELVTVCNRELRLVQVA
jgi:hypothetical protein